MHDEYVKALADVVRRGLVVSVTKEGYLHKELGPESVILQYTTVSSASRLDSYADFCRPDGLCTL
jgi:hypothetical protein